MVTAPLFIVLLIAAFIAVKYTATKPGGLFLGVLVGLSLSSTSFGPPILTALQNGMTMVINGASGIAG
jgi:hypothetical protein